MRITDIFDAVRDGTYADFRKFYTGDPNLFNKYAGMSLLQLAFVNDREQMLTLQPPKIKEMRCIYFTSL